MQNNFNDVEFLFPNDFDIENFVDSSPSAPFSDESVGFLNELSQTLNNDRRTRNYSDVATFAFFCRKANIKHLKKKYLVDDVLRLGRGVVFHVAPSNVPVNFAYSLLCGVLTGNLNIVRIPSTKYEQITIICEAIDTVSQSRTFNNICSRIALVRYERHNLVTSYFSSICDVRIIWGGDTTIEQIRESKLPARAFDITFADRYSLCIINADNIINEKEPDKIALGFYNDTYLFDQNACTAPHLIIWLGSDKNVKIGKDIFWRNLYNVVKSKYSIQPTIAVEKMTCFFKQAARMEGVSRIKTQDNLIWRIDLKELSSQIDKYRCSSGYFSEYQASSIQALSKIINNKYQTLAYYGVDKKELNEFMLLAKPKGIDRIVPIGKTTEFSLTWDGFNLIEALSRAVEVI